MDKTKEVLVRFGLGTTVNRDCNANFLSKKYKFYFKMCFYL